MRELYIPLLVPQQNKVITYSDREVFRAHVTEESLSNETAARTFVARQFGLTAVKAISMIRHGDHMGYAVHTAIDQPFELSPAHRFIVGINDIDEYLGDGNTNDLNAGLVAQAVANYERRR